MGTVETSTFPALVIEWLPGVGPGTTTGTWSDITQHVMSGTTFRGRQYELDQFATGTCTLEVNTQDRLFDPEYTSGTYFGQLIPMAQIRVRATWSGTTYDLFRGYITDWGQTVEADDKTFWTTISASDGFVLLERLQLPSSAWALMVQRDSPTLWFRLGETDTVRVTDSSDGGNYGLFDNVTQGAQGLVPNDADGAVNIGADFDPADSRVTIQNPDLITAYPFTVTALFQVDDSHPDTFRTLFAGVVDTNDATPGFEIGVMDNVSIEGGNTVGGKIRTRINDGSNSRRLVSSVVVADGLVHHGAFVFTNSTTHAIFIDGVDVGVVVNAATAAWLGTVPTGYTIGNYTDVHFGAFGFRGIVDEICVWNGTALNSTQVADHSLAAKSGWDGDDSGARVTRFLDAINWPASLRSISTGVSILGPARWSTGASALQVLRGWADTEYGLFYMNGAGNLVWKSRHSRYLDAAATTSQATFGDTRSGVTLRYVADGFELTRDEALIRNPVTASRVGGVSVTVKDQTLIDNKYWYLNWSSPATEDQKDSAVRDRALWLLARYKEQTTRLKSMKLKPRRDPANLWPQALGREIGDRITLKRTPLGIGNQISLEQWIESVRHEFIADRQWTTTFSGSPVEDEEYLVLNDASRGLLNTGQLAY